MVPNCHTLMRHEEKRVVDLVRKEFETNVANVPSEFELVVGKYNFDYGDNYTEFCGKTSFGREFGGVLSDNDKMIDFHISIDNPKLCAYSENQNNGELRFGWEFGDDDEVFVSKPQFLFPSSQDEDIAATGDNVYLAMTTPYDLGVMVMASHDGGFLFENPEIVNQDLRGVAQNPSISTLGNNIYVVWEETDEPTRTRTLTKSSRLQKAQTMQDPFLNLLSWKDFQDHLWFQTSSCCHTTTIQSMLHGFPLLRIHPNFIWQQVMITARHFWQRSFMGL